MHDGVVHTVCTWKQTYSRWHAHTHMLTHTYSHTHAHTSRHVSCRWHGKLNDAEGWFHVCEEDPVISVFLCIIVYCLPNSQLPALRTLGSVVAGSDSQTQVS